MLHAGCKFIYKVRGEQVTLWPKMPLQKPLQDAATKSGAYLGASSPAQHFTCTDAKACSLCCSNTPALQLQEGRKSHLSASQDAVMLLSLIK